LAASDSSLTIPLKTREKCVETLMEPGGRAAAATLVASRIVAYRRGRDGVAASPLRGVELACTSSSGKTTM
jgi:hypothetical protein